MNRVEKELSEMQFWATVFISTKPRENMQGYSRSRDDFLELLYAKYYPMEELNGCLWLWCQITDYKLTTWLLDALPTLYEQDEIIYEYNQYKQEWSKLSCTLFSAIWAISDLFNIEIPLDTIKQWDKGSYNHWRREWEGRWVQLAVDYICDCYNNSEYAKKYWKAAYYSFELKDNELLKWILDKRYTVMTGYNWNYKYNNDRDDNWVLNGTEFWKSTYGHAINTIWSNKYPARIKDSSKWRKTNIYEVEHKFSEIPCFFERWFIYTKVAEDALEEVKRLNKMKTLTENMIRDNSSMWHLTNDESYKNKLHEINEIHRAKIKTIEEMLKKYM